jgi:hypothetical protein
MCSYSPRITAPTESRSRFSAEAEARRAVGCGRELEHLALHRLREAVDAADAVGHRDDGALVADVGRDREAFDAALDQLGNFSGIQLHGGSPFCRCRDRVSKGLAESDRSGGGQRGLHLFEADLDRGVEHLVADHDPDAADELRDRSRRSR